MAVKRWSACRLAQAVLVLAHCLVLFQVPAASQEATDFVGMSVEEGVRLAAADATRLAADLAAKSKDVAGRDPKLAADLLKQMEYVRYFFIGNVLPEDRELYVAFLDVIMNSLSTRRVFIFLEPVPGSELAVLRARLDQYNIPVTAWDELGRRGSGPLRSVKKKDFPERYLHEIVAETKVVKKTVTKTVRKRYRHPPRRGKDGQMTKERFEWKSKEVEEEIEEKLAKEDLQHASWLEGQPIATLALTVKTDFPLCRGDWFAANATIAPAYYEFFGVKTLADLQKLARYRVADEDLAVRGVVSESDEVAINIRATEYTSTSQGGWYETFDYLTSIGEDDLLKNLKLRRRDAGEFIFTLPNGLQGYGIANDSDTNDLIDFADPHIACDTRTRWRVKTVWAGMMSCAACHDQGIKPVTDEVRLMSNPKVSLLVRDRKDFQDVLDKFSLPFEEVVLRGQAIYAKAINAASRGKLTPKKFASMVEEVFVGYWQDPVTMNVVCREVGRSKAEVAATLERLIGPDHTLSQLYLGRPVRRDQWQAKGFGQLMIGLRATSTQSDPKKPPAAAPQRGPGKARSPQDGASHGPPGRAGAGPGRRPAGDAGGGR